MSLPVPFGFALDLPIVNDWENVDRIRTSILNCFIAIFPPGSAQAISVANVTSELLENAIKYGAWKATDRLRLKVWGEGDEVRIQVENPIEAGASARELMDMITWLSSFPSPAEAYQARMMAFASAPTGATKLGLARIAYEGACRLSAEVDGGLVRVTGVSRMVA
jgi:hypothetical protein